MIRQAFTLAWQIGEQGWRSGESACLPQCGPGSIPGLGVICGLSLLLVVILAKRGFSPGTLASPSPQKPTSPKCQFDLDVVLCAQLLLCARYR